MLPSRRLKAGQADRIGHGVVALDIDHQEPVLVMLSDSLDYIRISYGLAVRGAIEVPVNLAYRGRILIHICNDSTAKTIIVDRQYLDRQILGAVGSGL